MGILSWIVVGAIAGWLAGMLVKGDESLGFIGRIGRRSAGAAGLVPAAVRPLHRRAICLFHVGLMPRRSP